MTSLFSESGSAAAQADSASIVGPAVSIRGVVIDSETGRPVPGAVVRNVSSSAATVADDTGAFTLRLEPAGAYVLRVEQLGYKSSQAVLPSTAPIELSRISIQPKPLELEGLRVTVAGQLERRRIRSAEPVEVVNAVKLTQLGGHGRELFQRILPLTRLCLDESGELCIERRSGGGVVQICIDEVPAYGGADELERLKPWEIHSVEVYERGLKIRVYTRRFMAGLLAGERELKPLGWCWP